MVKIKNNLKRITKNRSRLPNVFNREQLIDLFDSIDSAQTMIGAGLGFFCGLRISEVVRLKQAHIDFENRRLKVEDGKGGKDEYCVIPPQFVEPLKLWLKFVGQVPYVFPAYTNPDTHIGSKEMFRKYVKALKKAGLRQVAGYVTYKNRYGSYTQPRYFYYFHTLRHTYATFLHEKGVDIGTISKLLRHNQVDTTMIYTHISNKNKINAVDHAFDPFKAYHFQKSEFQTQKESQAEEREHQILQQMSNPVNMLQMKLVNGEISPSEYHERLNALRQSAGIVEVAPHA